MGIFSSTCMITNTPIKRNRAVVGLVLIKREKDSTLYPLDSYQPICGPIYGLYNGYGGIKPNKLEYHNWLWDEFIKAFSKEFLFPPGYNLDKLLNISKNDKLVLDVFPQNLEDLTSRIDRDDEFGLRDNFPKRKKALRLGLVHKKVWDFLKNRNTEQEEIDEQLIIRCVSPYYPELFKHYPFLKTDFIFSKLKEFKEEIDLIEDLIEVPKKLKKDIISVFNEIYNVDAALTNLGIIFRPSTFGAVNINNNLTKELLKLTLGMYK